MSYPVTRLRRLRGGETLRALVRETTLSVDDLIAPLFFDARLRVPQGIAAMPGQYRWPVAEAAAACGPLYEAGVRAVLLFGLPSSKDARGTSGWDDGGIVQQATRAIKGLYPDLVVITDVCLCEYTDHGHCGVLDGQVVSNDRTLPLLALQALSHLRAGADMVAPSDMMDGRVGTLRAALDAEGFSTTPIMAYSAKYASGFYGPFREAAESAPSFGDRRSYQMDPANAREALHEVALDREEGADIVMVKPALAYLDIIQRVRLAEALPIAAYNVSGEYSMVKAAAANGWIDEVRVTQEILTSIKRAGADMLITYHAHDAARWLKAGSWG